MAITLRQVYLVSSFILAAGLLSMGETNEAQGKHKNTTRVVHPGFEILYNRHLNHT
jgi:hypothetical protein